MDEEGKNKWLKMQDGNTNTETFFPPPSSSTNIPGVEHEAHRNLALKVAVMKRATRLLETDKLHDKDGSRPLIDQ